MMRHVFQPQSICYGLKKTAEALFIIYRFYFSQGRYLKNYKFLFKANFIS